MGRGLIHLCFVCISCALCPLQILIWVSQCMLLSPLNVNYGIKLLQGGGTTQNSTTVKFCYHSTLHTQEGFRNSHAGGSTCSKE
ncbi:hypothetical protein VNO80_01543 [Phaseolus coccineus]|uniref:Uncharacterized protein n=1 Tax=Phaseolus coccineus TaxID=3886 RepID=A0AAN9RSY0_PHACN